MYSVICSSENSKSPSAGGEFLSIVPSDDSIARYGFSSLSGVNVLISE